MCIYQFLNKKIVQLNKWLEQISILKLVLKYVDSTRMLYSFICNTPVYCLRLKGTSWLLCLLGLLSHLTIPYFSINSDIHIHQKKTKNELEPTTPHPPRCGIKSLWWRSVGCRGLFSCFWLGSWPLDTYPISILKFILI